MGQEVRRAGDKNGGDVENVLLSVEAELSEAIGCSGIESELSIKLAAKADNLRQELKAHQASKATNDKAVVAEIFSRKSRLLAEDGKAQATDGWQSDMDAAAAAAPALSVEEQELIAEHRQARLIVSHQASDW